MNTMKKILCPVDFSEYSAAALKAAGGLAEILGAELAVLHARRIEAPIYFTVAQTKALKEQLRRSDRAAWKYTEKFVNRHLPPELVDSIKVIEGDAVDAVLKALQKSKADLVVMGTHGRTGLTRIRLGSVAESVLRQTKKPIVTVGPQALKSGRVGKIQNVFCPVDYSELSHRALEWASEIAEKAGARLTVGHVQTDGSSASEAERARQVLCGSIPTDMRGRCSIEEVVRQGRPAEQIVREAEKLKADLVVLGARPRHDLGSLLFGSTTETVIRSATCPVLSVIAESRE